MVEKSVHYRVDYQPAADADPTWEVFVRDDSDDQLRHVGTLPAPSARKAYEQARRLFGWFLEDLWVCPASGVRRYESKPSSGAAEPVDPKSGEESRTHEV